MAEYPDYAAKVTCRSRLSLISDIRRLILNTPKEKIFRDTCFGWLLDLPKMQECGVLVHYFICHQVPCEDGETNIVPLRYRVRDFERVGEVEVKFGREEFCIVTGLRFGPDFRNEYADGPNLFRRRVFPSSTDSHKIKVGMLLDMIKSKEFSQLSDMDGVRLCLLGVLMLVLKGTELKNVVDGFLFRLVEDIKVWNVYPWGSYVWPTLYKQLKNAAIDRRDKHFAEGRDPSKIPLYTLNGFVWAFKTWILEMFRKGASPYFFSHQRVFHPRSVAWGFNRLVVRESIDKFLDDQLKERRPSPRLTPDEYEQLTEWWRTSKAYFEGNPVEPPVIHPQVSHSTEDDIPPFVLQKLKAYDARFEEHELKLKKIDDQFGQFRVRNKQPVHRESSFVGGENVGFSEFSVIQNSQVLPQSRNPYSGPPNESFFEGVPFPTPPVPSMHPSPFLSTGHNANPTPMGFSSFATPIHNEAGPSSGHDVAVDIQDAIERTRRQCRPGKYQQYPWTQQGPTTILPKKHGVKSKKKKSTSNIPPFNLEEVAVAEDALDDDVAYLGCGIGEPLRFDNVDPTKVKRGQYESLEQFLMNPYVIRLDCLPKGWFADLTFFQYLLPDLYKMGTDPGPLDKRGWLSDDHMNGWAEILIRYRGDNFPWTVAKAWTSSHAQVGGGKIEPMLTIDPSIRGTLDGTTRPYPSWDVVRWVVMPMNPLGNHWMTAIIDLHNSKFLVLDSMHSIHHFKETSKFVTEWTNVLNECLEAQGHFTRTGRGHYNFEFSYNNDGYLVPQQENFSDCGVITCWLMHEFVTGKWPPRVNTRDTNVFFSNVRLSMAQTFYNCRCEDTSTHGYD